MSGHVFSFDELTAEHRASAGGKGGTLAWLYQAGYPAPDGFVIKLVKPTTWSSRLTNIGSSGNGAPFRR